MRPPLLMPPPSPSPLAGTGVAGARCLCDGSTGEARMGPDGTGAERGAEHERVHQPEARVASHEPAKDGLILTGVIGGSALALLFNTFIALIPG